MFRRPVVLQCVLVAFVLAASLFAQAAERKPSVYVGDDSDWLSILKGSWLWGDSFKPRSTEPLSSNFRLEGVWIRDEHAVINKFGPVTVVGRGDGAISRDQACYVSPNGEFYFVVEWGELDAVAYLFDRGADWNGREFCAVSPFVVRGLSAGSGLKLGMSSEQLRSILGEPSLTQPNRAVYSFDFKHRTSKEDLKDLRAKFPEMSDEEFRLKYETSDVTSYIDARFSGDRLIYLAVSESDQIF